MVPTERNRNSRSFYMVPAARRSTARRNRAWTFVRLERPQADCDPRQPRDAISVIPTLPGTSPPSIQRWRVEVSVQGDG